MARMPLTFQETRWRGDFKFQISGFRVQISDFRVQVLDFVTDKGLDRLIFGEP